MDDIPIGGLLGALIFLIFLSSFFSSSETAMMALNRYRLRHLAESGHFGARLASQLLERPDRLLGVILLGNNAANLGASALATIAALKLYGEPAVAIATALLVIVVLIFAEVAPKTVAVLYPERIALPAAYILRPLLTILYPIVWMTNAIANGFLRLFGVSVGAKTDQPSIEELRAVVRETGTRIPKSHQSMLLRILDLEKITVDDVMVPRSAIEAIDLDDDWEDIVSQLATSHHTRLPVYQGSLDNIVGVLHIRKVLHQSRGSEFDKDALGKIMRAPYFVPEGTPVTTLLLRLQSERRRFGLVVDEYGDLKGIVTVEEILEEIVGEFTTQAPGAAADIVTEPDGTFIVDGASNIRELNRKTGWDLPTDGPKTLNGLILEYMEEIPEPGTSLLLAGYPLEIIQTRGTAVTRARINPNKVEAESDAESN